MTNILAVIGGILLGAVTLFALPLFAPLVGALTGLIVGWVFDDTFRDFLDAIGMQKLQPWQFGVMLGFIGGWFRGSTTVNKG